MNRARLRPPLAPLWAWSAFVFFLVSAPNVAPPVARATSARPVSVEELARRSDVIVRGVVRSLSSRPDVVGGIAGIYTEVVVDVSEVWAGAADATLTLTVHGGRVGARMQRLVGQASFAAGERVVVFLTRVGGARLFPTDLAQGVFRERDALDGPLVTSAVDRTTLIDVRGVLPEGTMPLDVLRERVVRARRAAR